MKYLNRSFSILFLVTFLICYGSLTSLSAPAAPHPTGGAPLRLRLKVERNTLQSDDSIHIWADFLDGEYNQVTNDGTRVVTFEIVGPRGATPIQDVEVKPGEKTAFSVFTAKQPGKVLIRVRSEGLDSDETFLLVTQKAVSLLNQVFEIFEPVAYADAPKVFKFQKDLVETEVGTRASLQIDLGGARKADKVRISTDPPAKIIYDDREQGTQMELTLDHDGGFSNEFAVSSHEKGQVNVRAEVISKNMQASAIASFMPPGPHRICFLGENPEEAPSNSSPCKSAWDMPSNLTDFWISLQFADDKDHPMKSDGSRTISLRSGNRNYQVVFEPDLVKFEKGQDVARTYVHLPFPLPANEFPVLAECKTDYKVEPRRAFIFIRNPVEKVTVSGGQSSVVRGNKSLEFTIGFADKENRPTVADKNRRVKLSVTGGTLSQQDIEIPKNHESATVRFVPHFADGTVTLKAESFGLTEATKGIVLITPFYWLALAAIGGALLGGFARHLGKSDDPNRKLPTFKLSWKSVAHSVAGSLISGFVFFLAMKLGLSQALGFILPASFDVGTLLAAFFFACIGGFMGVERVFDGIANLWSLLQRRRNSTQPIAPPVNNAAQPSSSSMGS